LNIPTGNIREARLPAGKHLFLMTALSSFFVLERDDRNKPIDFTLSDSDKTIISNAGDDRLKASKTGVTFVGWDLGKPLGSYIQVADTVIVPDSIVPLRYAPQMHCISLLFHLSSRQG
jgi:hypothetical protein